jgi:hypothetical protein
MTDAASIRSGGCLDSDACGLVFKAVGMDASAHEKGMYRALAVWAMSL